MARGLDHIVHAVRDLDAAAALYQRLGFQVGARNAHPWGTHNHIVQMPGFFIEVLTLAEPHKLGDDALSTHFGKFQQNFLAGGEGFSTLILESKDAPADAADLAQHGIGSSPVVSFERAGKDAKGQAVTVGFELAFAREDVSPDLAFALCRQKAPQSFWNTAMQAHPNGVSAVGAAMFVAENPTDHHIFLSSFTGERSLVSSSWGVSAPTPRGNVEIVDPVAFRGHTGMACAVTGAAMTLAALRLKVPDLGQTQQALKAGGVAHVLHMGRVVVGPTDAMGATLVFEAA